MNSLTPTPITDKNGKQTTVHKKQAAAPANSRVSGVSAPVAPLLVANQTYAHNDEFSGNNRNIPVIGEGSGIEQADAGNWHVASKAEVEIYEAYWNAEDAGKSKKDVEAIAEAAAANVGTDLVSNAVAKGREAIANKYRLGSGEVVRVTKVEFAGDENSTVSGEPSLRFTVVGNNGKEFQFLNTQDLRGMEKLRTDAGYYKESESFEATNTSSLDIFMGYPFTAGSVYDIALLAGDGADYPSTNYPILTGYGVSVDISTGEVGSKFEFTGIDGDKKEYVVPADKKEQLDQVNLQPIRSKWNRYDPAVLR